MPFKGILLIKQLLDFISSEITTTKDKKGRYEDIIGKKSIFKNFKNNITSKFHFPLIVFLNHHPGNK